MHAVSSEDMEKQESWVNTRRFVNDDAVDETTLE